MEAKRSGTATGSAALPPAAANENSLGRGSTDDSEGSVADAGGAGGVCGDDECAAEAKARFLTSVEGVGADGRGETASELEHVTGEKGSDWLPLEGATTEACEVACDESSCAAADVLLKRFLSSLFDGFEATGAGDDCDCCCCCM